MAEKFDGIVVGAGPAGIAAALRMAGAGMKVAVIERGEYPGSKNVMGGILYRQPTEELVPRFYEEAPLERPITESRLWLMGDGNVVSIGCRAAAFAEEPHNAYSVLRAKFDQWFASKAVEKGALVLCETVVRDCLTEGDRVVGIRTDRPQGELLADVVVLADGVNSLLARELDMREEIRPDRVAQAVKEVISLPPGKIEDRFNIERGEGVSIEAIGDATRGLVGTAWIYTNRDSISIGVGGLLEGVGHRRLRPNDLIEHFKGLPPVRRLIEGGKTEEYLAHLIPEGGYRSLPRLVGKGVMVVGDAAMLVNGLHREGSNMAMISGKFAGEAAVEAWKRGDFSRRSLEAYVDKLKDSFIIKDLKKYSRALPFFERNPHFFRLYPGLVGRAVAEFLTVDGVPKREKQARIFDILYERGRWNLYRDLYNAWRVLR